MGWIIPSKLDVLFGHLSTLKDCEASVYGLGKASLTKLVESFKNLENQGKISVRLK